MIEYRRNNEDLKRAVREHSIEGYPLKVPIFGQGRGIKTSSIRELVGVVVAPEKPITFRELSEKLGWSSEKKGLKDWVQFARERHMPHADIEPLRWIHPKTRVLLEEGYKVSQEDIQRDWLKAAGSIDDEGNVISYSFDLNQVQMHPEDIEPGMIVEFLDGAGKVGTPGRVVGVEPDPQDGSRIIFLETFEPMPALMAPKALAPWLFQPSFIPEQTWVIGYGTLEAMKRKKVAIPPGMFDPKDDEKRVYFLDQPIPLSMIEDFCKKYYPEKPECVWQSMTLIVLPLHPARDAKGRHSGGVFRPLPDDLQRTDIEANIDYYGEGMTFEE